MSGMPPSSRLTEGGHPLPTLSERRVAKHGKADGQQSAKTGGLRGDLSGRGVSVDGGMQ